MFNNSDDSFMVPKPTEEVMGLSVGIAVMSAVKYFFECGNISVCNHPGYTRNE